MIADQYHYVVAAVESWNRELFDLNYDKLSGTWHYAETPEELRSLVEKYHPRYVFFPHWRWIVPENIISRVECVCFHMTNLPYGRGGSPLQNLISRGHKETVLTALRMNKNLDSGPIYKQLPLSLDGSAEDIYRRSSKKVWTLIAEIVIEEPTPIEQAGEPIYFKRRQPDESEIPENLSMAEVYDFIRMLDAPGYPKAFRKIDGYRIEFENAEISDKSVIATARIVSGDQ